MQFVRNFVDGGGSIATVQARAEKVTVRGAEVLARAGQGTLFLPRRN